MGLDIHAISKIGPEVNPDLEILAETGVYPAKINIWISPDFPQACNSFEAKEYYTTIESEEYEFRAGSYTGYGNFKRHLCKAFNGFVVEDLFLNPSKYEGCKFWGLLDFSDCEGTMCYSVAKPLHDEFIKYEEEFKTWCEKNLKESEQEYNLEMYSNLKRATELAANEGAIFFM